MRRLIILLLLAGAAVLGGSSAFPGADDRAGGGGGAGKERDGRVVRVVDGDTLKVAVGGREESVRLIGVDTPESVKPDAPVECGAKAASRAMDRLVLDEAGRGRRVFVVSDPTQGDRDRYDRLLAYVVLPGGKDVGRAQVQAGWAELFVFGDHPFRRVSGYRKAFRDAKEHRRGVHGACGGDFHDAQ